MDRSMPHLPLQHLRPKAVSADHSFSTLIKVMLFVTCLFVPTTVFASSTATSSHIIDMTHTPTAILALLFLFLPTHWFHLKTNCTYVKVNRFYWLLA